MGVEEQYIQLSEVCLHLRIWKPETPKEDYPVFLLLHGLSSNAKTWDLVASRLAEAGYLAIAVDQRGHGLSSKPAGGYDFATITEDLAELGGKLGYQDLILAGQSWGGNVVLEVAARHPEMVRGLVFVDGGFLQISTRGPWEEVSMQLHPPDLVGISRTDLADRIGRMHPGWVPEGVDLTLGNFELLRDGTIRPWLSRENHMTILRSLYDQDVTTLFPQIQVPVLICPADDSSELSEKKRSWVENAARQIASASVRWFEGAAHDIHVDRPKELASELVEFAKNLV
jgi:pimeloyl-ACP methyl ester carboxylesterase